MSPRLRLLRHRARCVERRPPVILVPPVLATRLVDETGRTLWGQTRRLWFGPSQHEVRGVRSAGLIEEFRLVGGLVAQDVFGGMVRFLEEVGGYRRGEDLFALDYDWRGSVADGAGELSRLIDRIRGIGDEQVDLLCVSSGGMVARSYMNESRSDTPEEPVRRVVYVGSPQRGSFSAITNLNRGIRLAPLGKMLDSREIGACQIIYESLPHPDERIFVDTQGRELDLDIYDATVWRRYRLAPSLPFDLQARLDAARRVHGAFDVLRGHSDTIVIGADHVPTPNKIVIRGGEAIVSDSCTVTESPAADHIQVPGDGDVPADSLCLPGMDRSAIWKIFPKEHHLIPTDPDTHRLALEALLATSRRIPAFDLSPTLSKASLVKNA